MRCLVEETVHPAPAGRLLATDNHPKRAQEHKLPVDFLLCRWRLTLWHCLIL